MKKLVAVIFALLGFSVIVLAQTKPKFWDDVQTIKKYDKIYELSGHPIIFVGSSSIRKWADLQETFGNFNVINRGVGGTVINDITFYLNDIVFPYQPRQIVLYVGENDLVEENATVDSILKRTIRLYQAIRVKMPVVQIVYIAMKPSPSRDKYMAKCKAANALIKQYLAGQNNNVFVDVFALMLSADGKSRPELFVSDMLHMNQQGYDIWDKAVKPYLLKN